MDISSAYRSTIMPPTLMPGDKVRFVSPASTPDRDSVLRRAKILEGWGLRVDFGEHAFEKLSFLAGKDDDRLADFNAALGDPEIRAIFATRGGKGSYRIADRLDYGALRHDPKFVVGFSDITALLLALDRNCGLVAVHGSVMDESGSHPTNMALRRLLMEGGGVLLTARTNENTAVLTTGGRASGRLIGGNLDTIAACAGWALPKLDGAILLLEAVEMQIGQVDRQLTMLRKAGHLDGVAGIAVGQFTGFRPSSGGLTVIDLLRDHLERLGVPILGGLPVGHGDDWLPVPHGAPALLDASGGTLTVAFRSPLAA
ncbi:LD-carboxypeptidase [Mesorhizobium sp. KR9-304]|uniref:S66 peptidase family protein n=1 Tax=Mesorhizobium sp. KR9-304 TaxID=3156614 RepID=UPI0032B50D3E